VVAAEGLGELGGLAVADASGHLAHRERALAEHLEGPAHADLGEVRAEARAAGLGEGALELTPRRGEPAGHRVELEVAGVLALDDLDGLLEEGAPALDCSGSDCHVASLTSGPITRDHLRG
jgi:hypothetical protein